MKPDWYSNVQPRRVVKPAPTRPWYCECRDDGHRVLQRPHRSNCPDCKARRPS